MEVQLMDWGRKGYREAWDAQERLLAGMVQAKVAGQGGKAGQVVFVEHPPVYTIGKSGHAENMLLGATQLEALGAECIKVDRGGDITFHGPGQLVVYPVVDLEVLGIGVHEYVHRLEEAVIRTVAGYGIAGERVAGATGVWIDGETPRARKICAIGVKCSRSVTMHGLALNVNTDLRYFSYIHPCGFTDKGVASIAGETGWEVPLEEVKGRMRAALEEVFGFTLVP